MNQTAAIILGAGMGTRMKSALPKVMHHIAGRPIINWLIESLDKIEVAKKVVVISPEMNALTEQFKPATTVFQKERLGTGHAVLMAKDELQSFKGNVLVLFGDSPFITSETMAKMIKIREEGASVVVLGFRPVNPAQYGRLIVQNNELEAIVEFKDASEEQRQIRLCNSGVMCIDGEKLFDLLAQVKNDNNQGEYYLTDIVQIANSKGLICKVVEAPEEETEGVNSRVDLARMEQRIQAKLRRKAMENGATLINPETVTFSFDTKLGKDVVIEPFVVFANGVEVKDNVTIKAFSHLEGAVVEKGAIIGPFARLRPQAKIGENVHIGNFVEIKKATIENGAKVNHLSYIGDARVGEKTNIGAGTITCNYDGYFKSFTDIGKNVFIGSNTCMVAPVVIGDGAMTGAGSVITKNVAENDLALSRSDQKNYDKWAVSYRATKQNLKDKKV
ncbi:MAG: bifunctional UDP-N-acetylglucosamine diphosphorylase/glucosamine-1-phosphate N-acetyltransferase GlmU [Alphaproteobacteria bacterium]